MESVPKGFLAFIGNEASGEGSGAALYQGLNFLGGGFHEEN
ncbi:hypothetical protein CHY_0071 [Carboxydothermus hydrogenoformans Z-2901]|uniref:Uncharacterized protein n=1 Tax=Carboxydothermus hydrogenoformans (strain ATCC BAA-161 / DSM 6008 / Z-2901) TaxID=246194 RepID=Q3AFZ1_CARHZ|nr:hypothetical protein CHY_0071 [Carboxydothermus hydrogenoformans Z-2901]